MRSFRKTSGAVLILLILSLLLCACGKLSGTYEAALGQTPVPISYTFSGDTVIYSQAGQEIKGTYRISDGKIFLCFGGTETVHDFTRDGNSIFIDGVELTGK